MSSINPGSPQDIVVAATQCITARDCQGLPGTARTDSSQEKGQAREGAEVKPSTLSGSLSERAGFVFLLVTDQSR